MAFGIRVYLIFETALAASKNDANFKTGQKGLENLLSGV